MWIVPRNIEKRKEYFHFATDTEVSKKDFQELSILRQSLMWRSKLSNVSTWWLRWKRVWWIRHLFGRILTPSMQDHFVTKYTALLEDIPVRVKVWPESENYTMIPDSFGRLLKKHSSQLSLFGDSLKTYQVIYQGLSPTFLKAYEEWATGLRADCLQRQKLAHLRQGNDCSFWQSTKTPSTTCAGYSWPTPQSDMGATNTSKQWIQYESRSEKMQTGRSGSGKMACSCSKRLQGMQQGWLYGKRKGVSGSTSQCCEKGTYRWPATPGEQQHEWEEPRTTQPGMGCTVNGYKFRTELLRQYGNGVVSQTAELAFRTLVKKHYTQ